MIKSQVKTGAVLSYLQLFLGAVISIGITPVILKNLGQSEYGLLNLATSTLSYLNLLTLGLGSAFIRFNIRYRVENDIENERRLNGFFLKMYLIISFIMAICGTIIILNVQYIFPKLTVDEIFNLKIIMSISLTQSCVSLPLSLFIMNINAYEKYIFAKCIGIIGTIVLPLGKLVVVLLGARSISIAILSLSVAVVTLFLEMIYAIKVIGVKFKFGKLDKKLLKTIYAFSIFIFINQIIDMVNWQVDTMILGIVSGTAAVAVYTIGASFNTYIISFSSAISSVLVPRVNKLIASNSAKEEINALFIKTGRIQFIIMALVILGFVFFGKAFIENFYATKEYTESYYIGLLLIIPLTIPLIQNLGIEIQRAYNKHQFRTFAYSIMAVLNIALSIPLGIKLGGVGCAIGTCVSLLLGNGLIMNIYYHKKLGLNMLLFWWNIMRFLPALILPCFLGTILIMFVDLSNIWYFLLAILCFIILYCSSMYFFGMNKAEKSMIVSPFKKLLTKNKNRG